MAFRKEHFATEAQQSLLIQLSQFYKLNMQFLFIFLMIHDLFPGKLIYEWISRSVKGSMKTFWDRSLYPDEK